jgi:hypothetical protein
MGFTITRSPSGTKFTTVASFFVAIGFQLRLLLLLNAYFGLINYSLLPWQVQASYFHFLGILGRKRHYRCSAHNQWYKNQTLCR